MGWGSFFPTGDIFEKAQKIISGIPMLPGIPYFGTKLGLPGEVRKMTITPPTPTPPPPPGITLGELTGDPTLQYIESAKTGGEQFAKLITTAGMEYGGAAPTPIAPPAAPPVPGVAPAPGVIPYYLREYIPISGPGYPAESSYGKLLMTLAAGGLGGYAVGRLRRKGKKKVSKKAKRRYRKAKKKVKRRRYR